ncbi:YhcH/YjgK/YiaL family protein [Dysgonomonas sp. Marseille-P4677]|uniref:YhcH/YjgK/YiaL family protein n=1 Tax=Dysgonomonas sp. Marseille-P4677 TaxID=2364790 RepID=UPI0019138E48|nr:YhcH/YjgK/YiaL family protein [Dysgonomonas sp. Marseille-P4677]MBK5721026.1 YhcH/YjgK/YiaL family protein [Dysgonomonas sp. Marseille-P4677]
MILDSLKNAEMYYNIHPLFKDAFEYLKSVDFLKVEPEKIELHGKDLFVMISDSNLKTEANAKLEVHNQYIDIQMPISKTETFGWKSRADLQEESGSFNIDRDIQFFEDSAISLFSVSPGDFVVFFPGDGHAPCIGDGQIRKVVVKIKI